MSRVAVVDIGTNSTRLLVAEVEDGTITELQRESIVTRLGEGVDATGRLGDEPQARVFAALDTYAAAIEHHGAGRRIVVMTSAVRDAANGAEFAATVTGRYGLEGRTLSGDDEARLSFLGATTGRDAEDPLLVIDIGGGSTEMIVGARGEVDFHVSTQVGVVRHTERHLHSDPPTADELAGAGRRRPARARGGRARRGSRARAGGGRRRRHRDLVRGDRPRARPLRPGAGRGPHRQPRAARGAARPPGRRCRWPSAGP